MEDIDQYNRIHEMMTFSVASESNFRDNAEAFGYVLEKHSLGDRRVYLDFHAGEEFQVLFKPLSGLLNQSSIMPL